MSKPNIVAIEHDDHHAKHIGRLADGRQFFLTTPFVPALGNNPGREFVALFLFDKSGHLVEAQIEDLGTRVELNQDKAAAIYEKKLEQLGEVEFCRIEVKPFELKKFGTAFGLVPRAPEEEDDVWAVEMMPGNYMAFFEPWDSGDYDT